MMENAFSIPRTSRRLLAVSICSLAAFFYVYEFFIRVMPSAMTDELMQAFSINARGLGILTALFYYGYTPMQIPAGLLLDRFGPRLLLSLSILVCGIATFAFGLTNSIWVAGFARLFIGLVSAFAFVGALVLASRWFAPKYFALIVGLIQLMGCIGAIVGEAPVAIIVKEIGWQNTMFYSGVVGVLFALLFWLIIRDRPAHDVYHEAANTQTGSELTRLSKVCRNPQTWTVGLFAFTCWAPIAIFADLWGVPYIRTFYNTTPTIAAGSIALVWIGIAIGGPVFGWWSNRISNRRTPLMICSIFGLISSVIMLYIPHLSWAVMCIALFFFGVAASSQSVTFGLVQDNNPPSVAGTAVGFNNMAVILGGVLFQPLIGFLLDAQWTGTIMNGVSVYSLDAYRSSLVLLPLCSILGILVCWFLIKETHCKPQY